MMGFASFLRRLACNPCQPGAPVTPQPARKRRARVQILPECLLKPENAGTQKAIILRYLMTGVPISQGSARLLLARNGIYVNDIGHRMSEVCRGCALRGAPVVKQMVKTTSGKRYMKYYLTRESIRRLKGLRLGAI